MQKLLNTGIGRFRLLAFIEGMSFLIILFITMPLKYLLEIPEPNYFVGMAHGIFFLAYITGALLLRNRLNWDIKTTFIVLAAAVIPFGTFWADNKIFVRYIYK